jgi:hypothetical protein
MSDIACPDYYGVQYGQLGRGEKRIEDVPCPCNGLLWFSLLVSFMINRFIDV